MIRHELTRFENAQWREVIALVQMKLNLRHTAMHNSIPFAVYYGRAANALKQDENTEPPPANFSPAMTEADALTTGQKEAEAIVEATLGKGVKPGPVRFP